MDYLSGIAFVTKDETMPTDNQYVVLGQRPENVEKYPKN